MPVIKPIVKKVGIEPSGTKQITANGEYDVKEFANAKVNVPTPEGYITPEGTITLTENGEHDVTTYATAKVDMMVPSGSKTITSNGAHDVTNYAEVVVEVPDTIAEVTSNEEMSSLMTADNAGKIVRFAGADETQYEVDRYYILKKNESEGGE